MTLDTLTRAQAETSHVRLQSSLVRASHEFRERFQQDKLLFRSRSTDVDVGPRSLSPAQLGALEPIARQLSAGEADLVREERVRQCCKRVRVWHRLTANPLLQYKQQQLAAARTGNSKKSDRRMHTTLLMALIVDIYEQRVAEEAEAAVNASSSTHSLAATAAGVAHESLPESVARFVSQRALSRRAAVDQLQSIVATVLHNASAAHRRVHLFGSLCGLLPSASAPGTSVDSEPDAGAAALTTFNPPERFQVFLHALACLHRCKLAATPGNARAGEDPSSGAASMGDVVFHHAGVSQHVAQKVVAELFREDFYWNLRFWLAPCRELGVASDWPPGASEELQARAVVLAASSRNALLNATRKIDADALLELLLLAWTQRAREVHALLDAATDREEREGAARLQQRAREQFARAHTRPISSHERALFAELADEFWNAPVPWASARLQARVALAGDPGKPRRPLDELRALFADHLAAVDAAQRPWDWRRWRWEADWEWGALVVADADPH